MLRLCPDQINVNGIVDSGYFFWCDAKIANELFFHAVGLTDHRIRKPI